MDSRDSHAWLEQALVIIVGLVLLTLTISYLDRLAASAERSRHVATVGMLNRGLMSAAATHLVRHDHAAIERLVSGNPMQALSPVPRDYRGEFPGSIHVEPEASGWYYDPGEHTLIYRFAQAEPDRPAVLRYRTWVRFEDRNDNGRFDPSGDSFQAIGLEELG